MADVAAPTPDDDQQLQTTAAASVSEMPAEVVEAPETVAEASVEAEEPAGSAPVETDVAEPETTAVSASAAEPVVVAPVADPPAPVAPVSPAAAVPSVASTIEVPASAPVTGASGEGGEWELLVGKVRQWIGSGQLQDQWQSARTPLSLLAGLIALLLVLRIYGALLAVIDSLPLLPGLLELAGLIAVVQFSLTRLVRSEERRSLIEGLTQRWKSFRGQG
jgi:hypothetical protein